jgi:hypothetical protein
LFAYSNIRINPGYILVPPKMPPRGNVNNLTDIHAIKIKAAFAAGPVGRKDQEAEIQE